MIEIINYGYSDGMYDALIDFFYNNINKYNFSKEKLYDLVYMYSYIFTIELLKSSG